MIEHLKHFRTTIVGVMMIVGSLASFIGSWIAHGMPPAEQWTILGAGLTAGAGFFASADAKVVNKQVDVLDERTK